MPSVTFLDAALQATADQAKSLLDRVLEETERARRTGRPSPWARNPWVGAWGMVPHEQRLAARAKQVLALARVMPWLSALQLADMAAQLAANEAGEHEQRLRHLAGWYVVARCAVGGSWDRIYAASQFPAGGTVKGLINSCIVSAGYLGGPWWGAATRSFSYVEARPLPGQPDRAKGVITFQRDAAGPDPVPYASRWVAPRPSAPVKAEALAQQVVRVLPQPALAPVLGADPGSYTRQRVIRALRMITDPLWREVGPHNQVRRVRPYLPGQVNIGGGPPSITQSTHVWRPGGRTERKLRMNTRAATLIVFGALTEAYDFIRSLHDALPKHLRKSRTWRDQQGQWHARRMDSMLRDLYANWEHVQLPKALVGVILNQLEDAVIGATMRGANSNSRSISGTGTNVTRAQGDGSMYDSSQATPGELSGNGAFGGLSEAQKWIMDQLFGPEAPPVWRRGLDMGRGDPGLIVYRPSNSAGVARGGSGAISVR